MRSFQESERLAEAMHSSRLFKTASKEAALAVVLFGEEVGLGPISALMNVQIIQGKPTLGASAVGALIQRSGRFAFRVGGLDDQHAAIDFYERRDDQWIALGTSTFTLDDARRAGLGGSPTWKAYPRAMLHARALTAGARQFCPAVTLGSIYDPEELTAQAVPDAEEPLASTPNPPSAVSLESLARAYGADAVFEAAGGALPTTDEELRAVAETLAATVPTAGAAEAAEEAGDA